MGMWSSPHKKRKLGPPATAPTSAGKSHKHSSGNEPGKVFKDPQGREHVVTRKRANRKRA